MKWLLPPNRLKIKFQRSPGSWLMKSSRTHTLEKNGDPLQKTHMVELILAKLKQATIKLKWALAPILAIFLKEKIRKDKIHKICGKCRIMTLSKLLFRGLLSK